MPNDKKKRTRTYSIEGVEIFETGEHKGFRYDTKALDDMVTAHSKVAFKPPIKDGHHDEKPGWPALGWVENVRRAGEKLVADFTHLPVEVYEALKSKRYGHVSSEIYHNYRDKNNDRLGFVLRAVSILGAELPEVKTLKPLRDIVLNDEGNDWEVYEDRELVFFDEADVVRFAVEETGNEWRARLKDPAGFQSGSFRRIPIKRDKPRVFAIIGRLEGEAGTTLQSYRFPKEDGWTQESVTKWVADHPVENSEISDNDYEQADKIELTTEGDVKEMANDKELKKLEEEKAELEKKLAEVEQAKLDEAAESEKKLKEQEAKLAEAEKTRKNTDEEDSKSGEEIEQLKKDLEETKKNSEELDKKFGEEKKRNDELQETRRQEKIEHKCGELKIPKFRPYIKAFLEGATATERVETVMFSSGTDEKEKEMGMEDLVDAFSAELNKMAESILFKEMAHVTEFESTALGEDDDPRVEADRRITAWMGENNSDDYEKAQEAVFKADPKLKEAYAAS